MTDEQIIEFLLKNVDYMVNNNIVLMAVRVIGWGLAKGLSFLIGVCLSLYDKTYGMIDITNWEQLNTFLNTYRPLIGAIMTVSIVILGYLYMFGKNKKHNPLTSVLILAVVMISSNVLFSNFNTWAVMFKDAVVHSADGATDGAELIRTNLYDLMYIDDQIGLETMSDEDRPQYQSLTEDDVKHIDINEVFDPEEANSDAAKAILKKKMQFKAEGNTELKDCYNGIAWTSIGNDYYYRYHFEFFNYFLSAGAVLLVYICLSYKNVRIIYELFTSRMLAPLFAANLSSKKKILKILEGIRDGYYALCFTALTLKGFFLFMEYLNTQSGSGIGDGVSRSLILLFVAFCVIDGANVMEKITGVDAGLSSMSGKVIAAMHGVRGVAGAVHNIRQSHLQNQNMKDQKELMQALVNQNQRGNLSSDGQTGSGTMQDGNGGNGTQMEQDLDGQKMDASSEDARQRMDAGGSPDMNGQAGDGFDGMDQPEQSRSADLNDREEETMRRMDEELDPGSGRTEPESGSRPEEPMERKETLEGNDQKTNMSEAYGSNQDRPEEGMFQKWEEKRTRPEERNVNTSQMPERETYKESNQTQPRAYGGTRESRTQTGSNRPGVERITTEKSGRDVYVGGEAVPKKERKNYGKKDER